MVQIEATLVRMNQNWRMLWRIQGIWWKVFEGVGQVERLVGDGGEVLGGEVQGVADDDGRGDYGGGGESGMGGESDGVEGIRGGENHVGNGGSGDDTAIGGNNSLYGRRGSSIAAVAAVAAMVETEQAMAVVAELEQVMTVVGSGLRLLLIA